METQSTGSQEQGPLRHQTQRLPAGGGGPCVLMVAAETISGATQLPAPDQTPSPSLAALQINSSPDQLLGSQSDCSRAPPFDVPTRPQENSSSSSTHLLILLCSLHPSHPCIAAQDHLPPEPVVSLESVLSFTSPLESASYFLILSGSLRPHESQHARPPCPSSTPGVHSDSRPSSQ